MNEFIFPESILCPEDNRITKDNLKVFAPYYTIKYNICKSINPKKIAEIGVRAGYSGWSFLQAVPTAEYIGLDANNGKHGGRGGEDGKYKKWAQKILSPYNYKLIDIDTQKVSFLSINEIDFFHVDGDHSVIGVQHDLDLAFNTLSENGVILIDDIDYLKKVKSGVEIWMKKMEKIVRGEYIKSYRGEMLIRKI